jgi:hypothetical protein
MKFIAHLHVLYTTNRYSLWNRTIYYTTIIKFKTILVLHAKKHQLQYDKKIIHLYTYTHTYTHIYIYILNALKLCNFFFLFWNTIYERKLFKRNRLTFGTVFRKTCTTYISPLLNTIQWEQTLNRIWVFIVNINIIL